MSSEDLKDKLLGIFKDKHFSLRNIMKDRRKLGKVTKSKKCSRRSSCCSVGCFKNSNDMSTLLSGINVKINGRTLIGNIETDSTQNSSIEDGNIFTVSTILTDVHEKTQLEGLCQLVIESIFKLQNENNSAKLVIYLTQNNSEIIVKQGSSTADSNIVVEKKSAGLSNMSFDISEVNVNKGNKWLNQEKMKTSVKSLIEVKNQNQDILDISKMLKEKVNLSVPVINDEEKDGSKEIIESLCDLSKISLNIDNTSQASKTTKAKKEQKRRKHNHRDHTTLEFKIKKKYIKEMKDSHIEKINSWIENLCQVPNDVKVHERLCSDGEEKPNKDFVKHRTKRLRKLDYVINLQKTPCKKKKYRNYKTFPDSIGSSPADDHNRNIASPGVFSDDKLEYLYDSFLTDCIEQG